MEYRVRLTGRFDCIRTFEAETEAEALALAENVSVDGLTQCWKEWHVVIVEADGDILGGDGDGDDDDSEPR